MAIPQKSKLSIIDSSATDLPKYQVEFPEKVLQRFPELRETQKQLVDFHYQVKLVLTRLFDEQNRARKTLTQLVETITSTQQTIQNQLLLLASSELDTDAVQALINSSTASINGTLASHIAATSAHGVSGLVVGTSDEQTLERKTIGQTNPRNGRFRAVVQKSRVSAGEEVVIGVGDQMLVSGPFTIAGRLAVIGRLVVV